MDEIDEIDDRDRRWLAARAREFRREMVEAEVRVWSMLKGRRLGGFKFRRQQVIGRAIVDFYCAERRLAVEIDGPTHVEDRDRRRDRRLAARGIDVVRIGNDIVIEELDAVGDEILRVLRAKSSHPAVHCRVGGRCR